MRGYHIDERFYEERIVVQSGRPLETDAMLLRDGLRLDIDIEKNFQMLGYKSNRHADNSFYAFGREISYTITMSLAIAAILLLLLYGGEGNMWPLIVYIALAGLSEGVSGLVVGAKATDIFPVNSRVI